MAKGMNLLERERRLNALRDKALRGEITTDQYVARAPDVMKTADRTAVMIKAADRTAVEAAVRDQPLPAKSSDHSAAGR